MAKITKLVNCPRIVLCQMFEVTLHETDNNVGPLEISLCYRLRIIVGDIDSNLPHHFNCFWCYW